ncbi:MAG: BamA/TamA family outer membrane protein [Acidobacteria bacterium]|nr:BamA/TamA family outer membrane protein [Acidobacteriota bacterium]
MGLAFIHLNFSVRVGVLLLLVSLCRPAYGQFASPDDDGFLPKLADLPPDAGLGVGLEYRKKGLANGFADFRGEVAASVKRYERALLQLRLPNLGSKKLFADFLAEYRNYPEENFWGLGPDAGEGRRTDFRLEDFRFQTAFGVRPLRNLSVAVTAGYLQVNTGRGRDRSFRSIEELFSPAEVPALDRQPDYNLAGAFVEYDNRDKAADPRDGGLYSLRWIYHDDRSFNQFSFHRFEADARRYIGLFKEYRRPQTIALRAMTSFSDKGASQQVPFFMQRTLGGADTLRGFRQYRFRDENFLLLNLEYRWHASEYVDVVPFVDAGRVFGRPSDLGLNDLEASLGVGGRLKFGERVIVRLDAAAGREGLRLWLRGAHTF